MCATGSERGLQTSHLPELTRLAADLQLEFALVDGSDDVIAATPQAETHLGSLNPASRRAFVRRVCELVRARGSAVLTEPEIGLELYCFVCPLGVVFLFAGAAFPRTPTARGLRELYGLTQAEARVARALAARESPKEIAEHFAVELSTIRTHLRSIQMKLGASSQTDLVRRLLWSAATFIRDTTAFDEELPTNGL